MNIKKNILNIETRSKIYSYIKHNPGVHFRNISKELCVNSYNLDYHLRFLSKQGLIIKTKENGYSRYFIAKAVGNNQKILLGLLRQKTPRYIIIGIMSCLGLSSKELCQLLGKSPATINFHLQKLIKNEIIELCPNENGIVFRKKPNIYIERQLARRELVYRLVDPVWIEKVIIMHKNSILDEIDKGIFESINNWCDNGIPKKVVTLDNSINRSLESLFDIFPNPYCV